MLRVIPSLLLAVVLAGCPMCPDGELLAIEGSTKAAPGQSVQFVFRYGDKTYSSPASCGGHWYVNGIEGGGETIGTVTSCGRYTAPATRPSEDPIISAAQYPIGTCFDCCPYAEERVSVMAK